VVARLYKWLLALFYASLAVGLFRIILSEKYQVLFVCGGSNSDEEGVMSSVSTHHGLALRYSGQVGKRFCVLD